MLGLMIFGLACLSLYCLYHDSVYCARIKPDFARRFIGSEMLVLFFIVLVILVFQDLLMAFIFLLLCIVPVYVSDHVEALLHREVYKKLVPVVVSRSGDNPLITFELKAVLDTKKASILKTVIAKKERYLSEYWHDGFRKLGKVQTGVVIVLLNALVTCLGLKYFELI